MTGKRLKNLKSFGCAQQRQYLSWQLEANRKTWKQERLPLQRMRDKSITRNFSISRILVAELVCQKQTCLEYLGGNNLQGEKILVWLNTVPPKKF